MAIEKVVLVLVELNHKRGFQLDEELEEMVELIRSANGDVVAAVHAKLYRPNATLFIGDRREKSCYQSESFSRSGA